MTARVSTSVRSATSRAAQVGADIASLEIRAGTLAHEVIAMEARATSIAGFLDSGPLAGFRRFSEAAGVATGSAIARSRDAGAEDLARAVRDTARAQGSSERIETLLDVAAAAIAWATILSLADDERTAAMPTRAHGRAMRPTAPAIGRQKRDGRQPLSPAVHALREGELRATHVLLGVCSAAQRRQTSVLSVAQLLREDAEVRVLVTGTYLEQMDTPVGLLSPEERHDMVTDIVRAREAVLAA